MVKGAGTYLSTGDGVHGYYKKMFGGRVAHDAKKNEPPHVKRLRVAVNEISDRILDLQEERDQAGAWRASVGGRTDHFKTREAAQAAIDNYREDRVARLAELKKMLADKVSPEGKEYNLKHIRDEAIPYVEGKLRELRDAEPGSVQAEIEAATEEGRTALKAYEDARSAEFGANKSPTYHLSVDIEPEQLMDWDKPLSEQSETVKTAATTAIKEIDWPDGAPTLNDRGEDFYRALSNAMNENRDIGDRFASEGLQAVGILGHRMKASTKDGDQNPNYVIYDDSKIHTNYVHFDKTKVTPGQTGPVDRKAVEKYLNDVLGNSVRRVWANIMHAGEFDRTATGDVIRISIHSMNPLSVAYHESLHAFMAKLDDMGLKDARKVLEQAGASAPIMNQLRRHLATEPDALKQLDDAEERAAYMYQFWSMNKLDVGPKVDNIFQRIAKFLREVTGLYTNDERAVQIMEYFQSGQFHKDSANPSAVALALEPTRAQRAADQFKTMTKPLGDVSDALMSAGGARLRDTGIPALRELADAMKLKTTSEGKDPGFLPAARMERSRVMNQLGADLRPYTEAAINEALEAMQNGTKAASTAGRTVAMIVNRRLQEMLKYMQDAGVEVKALGMEDGVPYFPRSWDASYISAHQRQFLAMMDKYVLSGAYKGDPKELLKTLMVSDGAEFNIAVQRHHAVPRRHVYVGSRDHIVCGHATLYSRGNACVGLAAGDRDDQPCSAGEASNTLHHILLLSSDELTGMTGASNVPAERLDRSAGPARGA
jgi:hypothetical protein